MHQTDIRDVGFIITLWNLWYFDFAVQGKTSKSAVYTVFPGFSCTSTNIDGESNIQTNFIQLVLLKIELLSFLTFCCFYACTWRQALCGLMHAISHCELVLLPLPSPPAALLVFFVSFYSLLLPLTVSISPLLLSGPQICVQGQRRPACA